MVDWRVRLPRVARIAALVVLVAGVILIARSYYVRRNNKPFRMVSQKTELSTQVTGIIEGIERRETKNDRLWILLRAARDISYSDGHHELENVYLEMYPNQSEKPDRITAQRGIVGADNNHFSFLGDVHLETHDALVMRTQAINYDRDREIAETSEPVDFSRENITGKSRGAIANTKTKQLELRSEVEITVMPSAAPKEGANKETSALPMTTQRAHPVTIKSARATFDQNTMVLNFTGGASAQQERDILSGETLTALLNEQKHVKQIQARGNSYLRTMTEGRAAEVSSTDMDFFLGPTQQLERAIATRNAHARSLDADSEVQLSAANIAVAFQIVATAQEARGAKNERSSGGESVLHEMQTEGRTVVTLAAPRSHANDARAANKKLSADAVKLSWRASGRDIERAEAVGNAELIVDPVQQSATAERKTLTAPRFDCDFYETGNLARLFTAQGGATKALIEAVQPSEQKLPRTLTADKMIALIDRNTQDVERFDAQGNAKFNQGDRSGQAENVSYTAADQTARLRGGEPVVWDSRARLKAVEIDSDLRQQISYARGRVATTYYSQEQTNGATPFAKVKSPVFVTSDRAEFQHATKQGIYTGDARAWQDDNFVRADRLTLRGESRSMSGDGRVESALYQARRQQPDGSRTVVPVFATADRMTYSDADRLLHYEGNTDIKQGTDRLMSNTADVYLLKDANEVEKTIAQQNVVVTQPGRRGTGDWGQYTAADETIVLKGEPAHVEDATQGTSESRRLTVYVRESRVVSDDASSNQQSTGRVRSTHRVRKQ